MRNSGLLTLIVETVPEPSTDDEGNALPLIETRREVFYEEKSVGHTEAWEARKAEVVLAMKVDIYAAEYTGERTVEVDGVRYHVERTYQKTIDKLELTLSTMRKVSGRTQ